MTDTGDDDYRTRLHAHLLPSRMRSTLIDAGAFLIIYEMMKSSLVGIVASFHERGWTATEPIYSDEYKTRFLGNGSNRVTASIDWLVTQDVLLEADRETMNRARAYRNELAHELHAALVDPDRAADEKLIHALYAVMRKIERFQGEIHLAANSDFDGQDVDPDDVHTGVRLISDLVLGLITDAPTEHTFPLDVRTASQSVVETSPSQHPILATPAAVETLVSSLPLSEATPDDIASLLRVSRRLVVMATVEYEFGAVAIEKSLQALEATVRHVMGVDTKPNYKLVIDRYAAEHPDSPVDIDMLHVGRSLRNTAAHPKGAAAFPMIMVVNSVRASHRMIIQLLDGNRTDPGQTPPNQVA